MFGFLRNGPSPESSRAIQQALVQQGLPGGLGADRLRVLTRQGNYAGRSVRYFRAFDSAQAAQRGVSLRTFNDLDAHPELVVGAGHVERDGTVYVIHGAPPEPRSPIRARADRADHGDDAHVVFPVSGT